MKHLASIVFLLIIVNLLVSCTSALICYTCQWHQGEEVGIECAFGGDSLTESSERNANHEPIESARKAGESDEEACVTFYGTNTKGQFFVLRAKIEAASSIIGRCNYNTTSRDTLCLCNTDRCNSEVPPGILKCHLCVHTAQEPNQGCISATNTISTPARNAGAAAEGKAVTAIVTAGALDLHKGSQSGARQNPDLPNKYQVCFTFEGTVKGVSTYLRAKNYIPVEFNGCMKTPQEVIDQGVDGTVCYCSTDLCNSQPGKAAPGTGSGSTGHREIGSSPVSLIIFLGFMAL